MRNKPPENQPPFNAEEWLRAQNEIDAQRFSLVPYNSTQVREWPRVVPDTQPAPNFLEQTAIPLAVGAGKTASNALLGSTGALFRGLGDVNEEGQKRALENYIARLHQSGTLPEYIDIVDDTIPPSKLSKFGSWLLDTNARVQTNADAMRRDFLGDNPNFYSRITERLGSSAIPLMFAFASGGGLPGILTRIATDASSEAGDFATDLHMQGRYNRDNAWNALMNFLSNAGLSTTLEFLPNGEKVLKKLAPLKKWSNWQLWLADKGIDFLGDKLIQEPGQRIIREASNNAEGLGSYLLQLLLGLGDYPRHLYEIATGE